MVFIRQRAEMESQRADMFFKQRAEMFFKQRADMESAPTTEPTMSNTPTLRFGEFDGEWSEKKLKDISTKIGSGSTPRGGEQVYQTTGITFIRSQNVNHDKLDLKDITYIPIEIHDSMKNSSVYGLDILLNITGASIGRSCVVPENFEIGNVNQHVCIIRLDNTNDPYFLQSILASDKGKKLVYQSQTGSGREGLNFKSIASFKFSFPTKPEQQKIATFLSAVDSSIEQLSQKEQLLRDYKKGVMQKIFSRQIRFKRDDGGEFEDWVEKRLGEVFKISAGGDIDKDNVSSERNNIFKYPIFSNSDKNDGLYGYSNIAKIEENCLTVSGRGTLGIAIERKESFYPIVRLLVLVGKEKVNYKFFENAINSLNFFVESTGVPQLTAPQISIYKVNYPSLPEQTKIANFLSALDKQIEQVSIQLAETKTFKRGLLQRMFV